MDGEFLATDVEGVEGIGAVGAVFEEVFFGLGEFFPGFVLAEAVAAAAYAGCLNGEDQTKGTVLLVCWYAFVAISKQCVNAFEICQRHLPI